MLKKAKNVRSSFVLEVFSSVEVLFCLLESSLGRVGFSKFEPLFGGFLGTGCSQK